MTKHMPLKRISVLLVATSLSLAGISAASASASSIIDDGSNSTGWTTVDNGATTGLDATAGNPDSTFTFSKNEMLEHSFGSSGADFDSTTIKFDIYFNSNTDYLGLWWGRATNSGDGSANALYMGPAGNPDSTNGELAGHFGLIKDLPAPCVYYCGAGDAVSTFSWEVQRWHTVELKVGTTTTSYYVDGQLVQTMEMTLPVSNTITFGGDDRNGWPFFNGVYVDNISVKQQPQMTAQLNFDSAGGSSVEPLTFKLGQSVMTAPTEPTRPGYAFNGWKTLSSDTEVSFPYFPVLSNAMVNAVTSAGVTDTGHYLNRGDWEENTWYGPERNDNTLRDVVKYSDGLLYAAIRESNNTLVGDPLLPDGYYLVPLDISTTLVAAWLPLSHHVSYLLAGGSSSHTNSFDVNTVDNFAVAPAPTRNGYQFTGWSDGTRVYQAGARYPKSGSILNDVNLTATWKASLTSNEIVGFAPGTSKLSKPMMFQLNTIAKSVTLSKQLTCVGYTSGPTVLAIDKYIALNRATVVCNYLATKNPKLANFKVKTVNTKIVSADQRKTVVTLSK